MRIAVVTGHYPLWSERFLERDLSALARLGHAVAVWAAERPDARRWRAHDGSPLPPALTRVPFAPRAAAGRLRRSGWLQLRRLPALRTAADALPWAPEIVLAHFATLPAVIGGALAAGLDLPFAAGIHARDVWVPWRPGLRTLRGAGRIVACNAAARDELLRRCPALAERIRLLRHGLPPEAFDRPDVRRSPGRVLAAGRFVPKKGFDILLRAFPEVVRRAPEAELLLVGEGPERDSLRALARTDALAGKVAFLPAQPPERLRRHLAGTAVLAQPSVLAPDGDRDGIPNVMLEAMALGTPVVGTDAGGLPEILVNGETGLAARAGDAASLAGAVAAALLEPEAAQARAAVARERVRAAFDPERNARELAGVLAEAASAPFA